MARIHFWAGEVAGVTVHGAGYGEVVVSHLRKQADGSYSGERRSMEPAAVGYKGANDPAAVSAERIEAAEELAASQGEFFTGTIFSACGDEPVVLGE